MKKQLILTGLTGLLIVIAGTWGILSIQAHLVSVNTSASLYITGTRLIPTVRVSTSSANCDPKHIPGTSSDPAGGIGSPAIKPHLCSIPTFTEQDARQFMSTVSSFSSNRIEQSSAHFTVTRVLFITNETANSVLNADTGMSNKALIVCYVEVYGDFMIASPFTSQGTPKTVMHHGQMVFDSITGNMLVMGIVT